MICAICQKRRALRYCPGGRDQICAVCCGTEREVTIHCPTDCEYLMEARKHERIPPLDPAALPHRDLQISEEFVEQHAELISSLSLTISQEAERSGAVDSDVQEALASLIQTYRTLQSGIIYESLPANPLAADLHRALQAAGERFRVEEQDALGMPKTRDGDILRALAFLDVFARDRDNGRRFGRSFLDALPKFQPPAEIATAEDTGSSLILP
jgi:hypothetical protein